MIIKKKKCKTAQRLGALTNNSIDPDQISAFKHGFDGLILYAHLVSHGLKCSITAEESKAWFHGQKIN